MANDKNPTEQLRNHMPATHSERNAAPEDSEAHSNPWDTLQDRHDHDRHWSPRAYKCGTLDFTYVLVLLGIGAAVIAALLLFS